MSAHARLRRIAPWAAVVALVATVALAYLGKVVCVGGYQGFWSVTSYCYSDVYVLWGHRGFDVSALPYAGPPAGYPVDYTIEYPPGMVFPAWLISLVTGSPRGFFDLHALTFALAAGFALWRVDIALRASRGPDWRSSRVRLLGFALSPGLVMFGMQNWDLWPVALVAGGLAAAARGRTPAAAVWFALGAATKWWPALLVVLLLAGPWGEPDPERRWSVRVHPRLPAVDLRPAALAAGVWSLAQLPAIAISPSGWAEAIAFHLGRSANLDSTAAAIEWLGRWLAPGSFWDGAYDRLYTVVSLTALLAGCAYILVRLARRSLHPGDAALALVGIFLLTGKVFSPQFVVWLLPVAVVATVAWAPVLAVEASNAAVWLLYGPWLSRGSDADFTGFLWASQAMSVVRSATVAWLVLAALLPRGPVSGQRSRRGAVLAGHEPSEEEDPDPEDRGGQPQAVVADIPRGDE